MTKNPVMKGVAKLCNSSGYVVWIFHIFWLVLLYVNSFFSSPVGRLIKPTYLPQVSEQKQSSPIFVNELPPIPSWILVVLAAWLVLLTLYIIFLNYIPAVNKTSEKIVEKAAEKVVEKIESNYKKNKHISRKKHLQLTRRMMFWIKISVSCLPIIIVMIGAGYIEDIPYQVAIGITSVLSLSAVLFFVGHRTFSSFIDQTAK